MIEVLGVIREDTVEHLQQIPGSPNLDEMKKIALTDTALILRKTLSM